MTRMTEVFKEAYNKSDRSVPEEQAMEWFFAGIAAQKAVVPPVRMADAEAFAAMRRNRYQAEQQYRTDKIAVTREGQIFLDAMRLLNHDYGMIIPVSEEQILRASELLAMMQADGAKFNQLTPSNLAKKRDTPYRFYKGYTELRAMLDNIVQNNCIVTEASTS